MRATVLFFLLLGVLITSCKESPEKQLMQTLKKWEQKEIFFPSEMKFTMINDGEQQFSLPVSNNKILVYVDSIGCLDCKLRMDKWLEFMSQVNSISSDTVPFLFFFHSGSTQEIKELMKTYRVDFPFCIDINDKLNKLNAFPDNIALQTFLLDRNNRVKVVGNPIHNLKIKKLYLKHITGMDMKDDDAIAELTEISCSTKEVDLGRFKHLEKQNRAIAIRNTGQIPLVVNGITVSCGCTTVDYDKKPVLPGETAIFHINYQAEYLGRFDKAVSIYCNTSSSPILIKVKGFAE